MTDNKFFTWVWRFNGVALALGLILIVSALSWNTISSWSRDNSTVIPVNPAQPADRNDPSLARGYGRQQKARLQVSMHYRNSFNKKAPIGSRRKDRQVLFPTT